MANWSEPLDSSAILPSSENTRDAYGVCTWRIPRAGKAWDRVLLGKALLERVRQLPDIEQVQLSVAVGQAVAQKHMLRADLNPYGRDSAVPSA